jgi:hypothetical protein
MENTDAHWRQWGKFDPYRAALCNEKYGRACLAENAQEFFQTGDEYIDALTRKLAMLYSGMRLGTAVDFGCGVGRLSIPLRRSPCTAAAGLGFCISPVFRVWERVHPGRVSHNILDTRFTSESIARLLLARSILGSVDAGSNHREPGDPTHKRRLGDLGERSGRGRKHDLAVDNTLDFSRSDCRHPAWSKHHYDLSHSTRPRGFLICESFRNSFWSPHRRRVSRWHDIALGRWQASGRLGNPGRLIFGGAECTRGFRIPASGEYNSAAPKDLNLIENLIEHNLLFLCVGLSLISIGPDH